MKTKCHIGVIGAGQCGEATYELARTLGREIGARDWTLVCGGLGGVMEGACRGCLEAGGTTVGILPGLDRKEANPWVAVAIPTGMGEARNALVVRASDILIAVSGGYGTLSEIALGLKTGKRVIGLETWAGITGIRYVASPEMAVHTAEELLAQTDHIN